MANTPRARDSHGRFKADHHSRNLAFGAVAVVGFGAAAVGAAIRYGLLDRFFPASEGHDARDLEGNTHPGPDHRAPEAFRPDPTAVPTSAERESLRPPPGFDVETGEETPAEEFTAAE